MNKGDTIKFKYHKLGGQQGRIIRKSCKPVRYTVAFQSRDGMRTVSGLTANDMRRAK